LLSGTQIVTKMPKKAAKSKRTKGRVPRTDALSSGSDDDGSMFNDTASMISLPVSEASTMENEAAPLGLVDETSAEEAYENKLKDAIDLAMEKAAATRIKGLEALCSGLLKRYLPDFLDDRRATLADIIERSLKRGKGAEVQAAARLSLLLAVQLPDAEDVYGELRGTMQQMITDNSQSASSRAAVASGLAGLCFIGGGELAEVVKLMTLLETIFIASAAKKDGTAPNVSAENVGLHTACLSAWALLSTLLPPSQIFSLVNRYMILLEGMFLSTDVDLRITAGEVMVLLLETAYDYDTEFEPVNFDELVKTLKQMATDSSKAKSKKDRKEQRSTFRDVLRGVEEGEGPSLSIKFGKESLHLDSWFRKCQYDWFCKMMGAGINYHLSVNVMLREIFELGAPLHCDASAAYKPSKTERNAANQQAFKLRTQMRSKNRDKRSAVY